MKKIIFGTLLLLLPFFGFAGIVNVGIGSGNLVIDGNVNSSLNSATINILGGTYTTITIQNISNSLIQNNGTVNITASAPGIYAWSISNLTNTTIQGNGTNGVRFGFVTHDIPFRAMQFTGTINGFLMKYCKFQKCLDGYSIVLTNSVTWNGTSATAWNGISFKYCRFDSCGRIHQYNGINVSGNNFIGVIKNFELFADTFTNSTPGFTVWLNGVDGFNIHGCKWQHINQDRTNLSTAYNDNGMVFALGWGSFYNNYSYDVQGYQVRCWTVSFGITVKQCLFYNNIAINHRKYSLVEVQWPPSYPVFASMTSNTYTNNYIFHNTIDSAGNGAKAGVLDGITNGLASPPGTFESNLAVIYGTGGNTYLYNNVAINVVNQTGAYNGITLADKVYNVETPYQFSDRGGNKVYLTKTAAGFNNNLSLITGSPLKAAGIHISGFPNPPDFKGQPRSNTTPSIGAIEQ